MKLRMSLDQAAIKQFFLKHVEKIVFALSLAAIGWMGYSALNQELYTKTESDLENRVQAARNHIQETKWDPTAFQVEPTQYLTMANRATDSMDATGYQWPNYLYKDKGKVGSKRGEPEYLPVAQLEATADFGAFAFKGSGTADPSATTPETSRPTTQPTRPTTQPRRPGPLSSVLEGLPGEFEQEGVGRPTNPGGAANPGTPVVAEEDGGVSPPPNSLAQGVQWVVIRGLVPIVAQTDRYRETFEQARFQDPTKDHPSYLGYLVERAEVDADNLNAPADQLTWERLNVAAAMQQAEETWAVFAPEVVEPQFVHEKLTFPLGPRLSKDWGTDAAHAKIPPIDPTKNTEDGTGPTKSQPQTPRSVGNDEDQFGQRNGGNTTRAVDPETGLPVAGNQQRPAATQASEEPPAAPLEYLLFRFFDFTVKEGKRYRYRVALGLANPNFEVKPQHLADPKLAEKNYRLTPWSDPTAPISVSSFNKLLAGAAKAPRDVFEAAVNLVAIQYDAQKGVKAVYEFRDAQRPKEKEREFSALNRGHFVDHQVHVRVVDPITHAQKDDDIHFRPKALVLDIRGGEPMAVPGVRSAPEKEPGEVLLLDSNGSLVVHTELGDSEEYLKEAAYAARLQPPE